MDDLAVRNELESKGRLLLEFTFDDVMVRFDDVTRMLRSTLDREAAGKVELQSLSGITVRKADVNTKRAVVAVHPSAWVASKRAWQEGLSACNRMRLSGWRLERVPT
ncbi:MAG: hypothetical protein FJ029_06550 [Actinobacteria bacterium]|nr:hypothetical protein [Actinomycetota bacterium]